MQVKRISKDNISPNLATTAGTIYTMFCAEVLALAAVDPATAALAGLSEALFGTWTGTHCCIPSARGIEITNVISQMNPLITGIFVLAGASIGYARGLEKRMTQHPDLQRKDLKALFRK